MSQFHWPTDCVKQQVLLSVPRERAWRAIGDSEQFGSWFEARFDGPFVSGTWLTGRYTPTSTGRRFYIWVERVEPPFLLAFRWHPNATELGRDYSKEPKTLVELRLEDAPPFDKAELELGRQLVLRFIESELPHCYEDVINIFRGRGAYRRYKMLLEANNALERWTRFEEAAVRSKLLEWAQQPPTRSLLTITESGFDALPPQRRNEAFFYSEQDWEALTTRLEDYLALHPDT